MCSIFAASSARPPVGSLTPPTPRVDNTRLMIGRLNASGVTSTNGNDEKRLETKGHPVRPRDPAGKPSLQGATDSPQRPLLSPPTITDRDREPYLYYYQTPVFGFFFGFEGLSGLLADVHVSQSRVNPRTSSHQSSTGAIHRKIGIRDGRHTPTPARGSAHASCIPRVSLSLSLSS